MGVRACMEECSVINNECLKKRSLELSVHPRLCPYVLPPVHSCHGKQHGRSAAPLGILLLLGPRLQVAAANQRARSL